MGDTFKWVTPGSGTFDVASEWIDQTNSLNVAFPGALDTALLIGPGSGTAQTITGPGTVAVLDAIGLNLLSGSLVTGLTRVDNQSNPGTTSLEVAGTLSASEGLLVGDSGSGALTVDDGSSVFAASSSGQSQAVIGNAAGSTGSVTIAAGGELALTGPAQDGNYGLVVGNSGTAALVVSGTGATVDDVNSDGVAVGYATGSFGQFVLSAGATATVGSNNSNSLSAIAVARAGDGVLTVDGSGTTLTSHGGDYIGRGGAGVLVISNHGVLAQTLAGTYFEIGEGSSSSNTHVGGTGAATVESDGTLALAGFLHIGGEGVDGALTVETGGLVSAVASASASAIGLGVSSTIDGSFEGGTGSLEIDAGGTVEVPGAGVEGVAGISVGQGAGAFGTADISGAGAVLNTENNLIVIGSGGTGDMTVSDGGAITGGSPGPGFGAIVIGNSASGVGTLTVSGTGSTATANGPLTVGYQGQGTLIISAGGEVSAPSANLGVEGGSTGVISVLAGGVLSDTGSLQVGGSGTGTLAMAGGVADASSVDVQAGSRIEGNGTVVGTIGGAGTVTASGGTLTLAQSVAGVSMTIAADGDLALGGAAASGEQVTFASAAGGQLDLLAPARFDATVGKFGGGDTIFVPGAAFINYDGGGPISLFNALDMSIGTIALAQSFPTGAFVDTAGTITLSCFAAGTRIATARGAVAVEDLVVGEAVALADGGTAPIVWIGHRRVDCARHPKPQEVMPVRVRAHAFGPGLPHADLLLSPDHAVFFEGVLIPVRCLIDGATIVQEARRQVTYWHVELPRHDVLLAEGLPTESFLDTGNRDAFSNGGGAVQLHPDFSARVWDADACAPLVLAGPKLEAARRRLARTPQPMALASR